MPDFGTRGRVPLLVLFLLAAFGFGLANPAAAQERPLVSSEVTVSGTELALSLEFVRGDPLRVVLRDGRVLIDGDEAGRYTRGGALEGAWRSLLGELVSLDEPGIVTRLAGWRAPTGLDEPASTSAARIEARLADALRDAAAPDAPIRVIEGGTGLQEAFESLVLQPERLRSLTAAMASLRGEEIAVRIGEPFTVPEGETRPGSLLALDADLHIEGEVEGSVAAIGGTVLLGEGARIGGDLLWAFATIEGNRDAVAGAITEISPVPARPESELREELRREIQAAVETATSAVSTVRPERRATPSALRSIGRGFVRVLQTVLTFLVLLGIGLALLYFFPRHFEVMARTARHSTGSSALVGLAGAFLAFPAWLFGVVALAVTIVGIPIMVLWIPLFPLAVAAAATVGLILVARNLGRWFADRDPEGFAPEERQRPAVQLGIGLAVLVGAFAVAGVLQMGGAWLGMFRGLFVAIGILATAVAGLIGFGAVLLSRGGRDARYAGSGWVFREGEGDPGGVEP